MLANLIPAEIFSYDQKTRLCRVKIDGITDGAEVYPEAEILYPIGDKSHHTELEILPGDPVWLAFQYGDPRYPVIAGSRAKNTGNMLDWRKYHHKNIELSADGTLILRAKDIQFIAENSLTTTASSISTTAKTIDMNARISLTGDGLTHNGLDVGSTHKHGEVLRGGDLTSIPK